MVLNRYVATPRVCMALLLVSCLLLLVPLGAAHPHDPPNKPPKGEPYLVEHEMTSVIGCSFSWRYVASTDWCRDPNAQTHFEGQLDPYLTTMVFYLDSDERPVAPPHFRVTFFSPPGAFDSIAGATPMLMTHHVDEDNAWSGWEEPSTLKFEVRVDNEALLPQVAFQQPYTICLGLFYNDMEVPQDYHPCP